MKNKLTVFLFSLLLLLSTCAYASGEVNLSTGRFYVSYIDMSYSGGLEPRILRTYNSQSQFRGMFGMGWRSEYETQLTVTGYGVIILHQMGEAGDKRFFPENWSSADNVIATILESAAKSGDVTTPEESEKLKQRMLRNPEFLDEQWNRYSAKRVLKSQNLALGAKATNCTFGYEVITRVPDGYVLRDDVGNIMRFNEQGRLFRIEDLNDNFVELTLLKNGNYGVVTDNYGRQMTIIYNDRNLVEKIVGQGGDGPERTARFKYNDQNQLVYSRDDKGGVDEFEYVSPHRMSRILFPNNKIWEMTYYSDDRPWRIKTFKDKDGSLSLYSYKADPENNLDVVELEVQQKGKKQVSKETHQFFHKTKRSGEKWTWREISTVDGVTEDTQNEEHCGWPKLIKTNNGQVSFDYDAKGRTVKRETASEITELRWDDATGRVTYVETRQLGGIRGTNRSASKLTWAKFVRDTKGNLILAENSAGKRVKARYDKNGRLVEMTHARQIQFYYNKDSQPKQIRVLGLGTLFFYYDSGGEILDVKSVPTDQVREATRHLNMAFDELADIMKMTTIKYSP